MKTLEEYGATLERRDGDTAWRNSIDGFPRELLEGHVEGAYEHLVQIRQELIDRMGMNTDEVELLDLAIEGGRVLGMGLFSIAHDNTLREFEAGDIPENHSLKMDGGHP